MSSARMTVKYRATGSTMRALRNNAKEIGKSFFGEDHVEWTMSYGVAEVTEYVDDTTLGESPKSTPIRYECEVTAIGDQRY